MKIGTKIYYELFIGGLKLKISKAEEDLAIFEKGVEASKTALKTYKNYIDRECSIDYNILVIAPSNNIKGSLRDRVVVDEVLYTKEAFLTYLNLYYTSFKRLQKHKEYIKTLKNQVVDYSTYKLIIKKFNLKISYAIVFNQYIFNLGYGLGVVQAIRKVLKNPGVDWNRSNKKKQQLIDKGLIPYYKEEEKEYEERGETYEGVEWLIKHSKENVWIVHLYENVKTYKFQLIKSNVSLSLKYYLNQLKQSKEYNPKAYPLLK